MGKIDLAAHVFFQKHKECYAELFNRFVFQKDIVDPDLLTPIPAIPAEDFYDETSRKRVAVYARVSTDDPR